MLNIAHKPPFWQTPVTGSTVNLKVLNLYCGIGGNRKLWQNVDVLMSRYPDNYFDLAIVDPPYGIGFAPINEFTRVR